MSRLTLSTLLVLVGCASTPLATVPVAETRPVVAKNQLQGRWTITEVSGRQVSGLWLELGAEDVGSVTKTGNGIFVASPQPPTRAHLGCNEWHPNGWARNGDKLSFDIEMSHRTERGCDQDTMALDDQAYEILRKTVTMEFSPPNHLRLINESGTLDLVRG